MRRFIALGVIALHMLLVWLLMSGSRLRIDAAPEQPELVRVWITLPLIPPAAPPRMEPPPQRARPSQAAAPQTRPAPELPETAPDAPTESIASVVPVTPPIVPPTESPSATTPSPAPYIDFARAATLAAKQAAADAAAAEQRGDDFSPPPKVLAGPCVPKERSMEWKGAENPGLKWYGPIPILVTKRCVISLGVFSCTLGDLPPANSHLFDDMQDPHRSRSSVPDPNICD